MMAVLVGLLVLGAVPSQAAAPVEAGKVYSGSEGEEVAVVPLSPRDGKKFLLRVRGTGTEFDGKVFPYTLNDWSSSGRINQNYYTQWHGRDYSALVVRGQRYELYVPGRDRNSISVSFDEKRTAALKSEEVWNEHQKQMKDGSLTKLMAFDRKGEEAQHDKSFSEALQKMNTACGTTVAAKIDWAQVTEEQLKKLSISSFCETPLSTLEKLCTTSNVAKQTVKEKVKQLSCGFGSELAPKLEADRVVWTTSQDAPNQEEFALKYFKQNL